LGFYIVYLHSSLKQAFKDVLAVFLVGWGEGGLERGMWEWEGGYLEAEKKTPETFLRDNN
jgi:hypothetical protein